MKHANRLSTYHENSVENLTQTVVTKS